jgi:F-type H+-transporting ATPase subunit a
MLYTKSDKIQQYTLGRKGGSNTGNLADNLMEELNCETVFTLPVLGGINESVVVTWIIMAVLVIASIILVRNLKVENPGKVQLALEAGIGAAEDFFVGVLGKENKGYVPYLITVLLYLACSNTIAPLFGFKPPTKDLNVTAALAIMSMCLIEFSGIRKNGFGHWAKHFAQPIPIVAPIMRLFGNMLAGFVVMELLKAIVPLIIPIPISFYFDIFDGLLQAYVFVFLTSLFMNEEME